MSNLLGIDIGRAKTGIARAIGPLAEPLTVIREKNLDRLIQKITNLARQEEIENIVIGIPQGEIEQLAHSVGEELSAQGFNVIYWDETLTTQDAQRLAILADIPVKKRKELEDAFSAAVMLQSFLEGRQIDK